MKPLFFLYMLPGKNQNKNGGPGRNPKKAPEGGREQFFGNLVTAVLIFLIIATVYSIVIERNKNTEDIPLSTLASDVTAGNVSAITVAGNTVKATYADGTTKETRKESEAALWHTNHNIVY